MKRFLPTHKEYLCTNEVLYTVHVTSIFFPPKNLFSCRISVSRENFEHNFTRKKDTNRKNIHVINTQMTFDCAKNFLRLLARKDIIFPSKIFFFSYPTRVQLEGRSQIYLLLMRHFPQSSLSRMKSVYTNFYHHLFKCKKKFALMIVCCH